MSTALDFDPWSEIRDLKREAAKAAKVAKVGPLPAPLLGWPQDCLDTERRFGQHHTRLGPLLWKTVSTPLGRGRLEQVFTNRVAVVLDQSPEFMTFFSPDEIRPA